MKKKIKMWIQFFSSVTVLRSLCVGPAKEEFYPSSLSSAIDTILDGWKFEETFEKIWNTIFDKIQDQTKSYKANFSLALSFISQIEDTLQKNSFGYLCSDKPTLADLYCYGYLVLLKIMNFNFGESHSRATNWFDGMEKQFGSYLSRHIQDVLEEYGKLFASLTWNLNDKQLGCNNDLLLLLLFVFFFWYFFK